MASLKFSKAALPSKAGGSDVNRREGARRAHQASFPFGDLLRFAPRRRTHRAGQSSGLSVRARTAERLGMPGTLPDRSKSLQSRRQPRQDVLQVAHQAVVALLKMGAFLSLFTANIVPARFTPTMCCIWPEMPMPRYTFGASIMPDTPM